MNLKIEKNIVVEKPLTVYLQAPASIFGKMVSIFSKSKIAHTFIHVGDGYYLEADLFGVRLFDESEFKKRKIIEKYQISNTFPLTIEQKIKLLNTVIFLKNKPYDYLLTISFLFKRLLNISGAYNCVETVKYVLDAMNIKHNITSKDKPCDLIKLDGFNGWKKC